ncbi:hypothetical protein HKX48_000356 [Thoreauomyces humboldtii]|nr:hypothetical protein HKX48_000356 [Thoreauomyces humboldtii]
MPDSPPPRVVLLAIRHQPRLWYRKPGPPPPPSTTSADPVMMTKKKKKSRIISQKHQDRSLRAVSPPDIPGFERALDAVDEDCWPAWAKFQDILVDDNARTELTSSHIARLVELFMRRQPSPQMDLATQVIAIGRQQGLPPTVDQYNALLDGHARVADFAAARTTLKQMSDEKLAPDMRTYNIFMKMYALNNKLDTAITFFDRMLEEDIAPDVESFNIIIQGAGIAGRPHLARKYHEEMLDMAYTPNARTYSFLMRALIEGNDMQGAEKMFLKQRSLGLKLEARDYAVLLKAYADKEMVTELELVWSRMKADGVAPDARCYRIASDAFLRAEMLVEAVEASKSLLALASKWDHATIKRVITTYCRAGLPSTAEKVLGDLQQALTPREDIRKAYGEVIQAFAEHGNVDDAVRVLIRCEKEGHLNIRPSYNAVLKAAGKAFRIDVLESCWRRLRGEHRTLRAEGVAIDADIGADSTSFSVVIEGFIAVNNIPKALEIWKDMHENSPFVPSPELYVALIECLIRGRGYRDAAIVLALMRTHTANQHIPIGTAFDNVRNPFTLVLQQMGTELRELELAIAASDAAQSEETVGAFKKQSDVIVALYKELTLNGARTSEDVFRYAMEAYRYMHEPLSIVTVFMALQKHHADHGLTITAPSVTSLLRGVFETAHVKTAEAAVALVETEKFPLDSEGQEHFLYLQARCGHDVEMIASIIEFVHGPVPLTAESYAKVRSVALAPGKTASSSAQSIKTRSAHERVHSFVQENYPELLPLQSEEGELLLAA